MAGLLDEPYIGYPQLARRSQSLLGGTPRGLLNTNPQISADTLRKLGEQLINIPTSATRAITDPQLFARLLGITPNQQLSGFSAGYAGLPAKPPSDIGVVDPRNIDYSKGYTSGEEMGMMTALAAPLAPLARPVSRALGEQAYRRTEDLLQSQGLMPSITAYHGTPHNIQGKFDINKVGTGEGAQAYGYGMYYAQNPAVAKEYQKMLVGPEATAAEYLQMYKTPESAISALEYGITPNLTAEAKKFSEDAINILKSGKELKGNLYKVDVPDEYVPKMLNWDKPLNQQPDVLENIKKLGEREDLPKGFSQALEKALEGKFFDGQDLYYELTKVYKDPSMLSKAMEESGFKGIRYLDEGSRNQAVQPYYQLIRKSDNSVYTQMQSFENAKEFVKDAKKQGVEFEISAPVDKRTSNFVVFDPKDVKILEKNSQKVESLYADAMPHYAQQENLANVFEKAGLKVKESGSTHSNSKYVEIEDPVSGEVITARFANHPQSGHAISLHGYADIEIGDIFKYKSWNEAVDPILERINKQRKEFGDELLTIKQVEGLLD